MSIDAVFNGLPTQFPSAGSTVALGLDTNTTCLWVGKNGWAPASNACAINNQLGITAEMAAYVYTVQKTGLYRISGLVVSSTTDAGTLPAVTVTYTDADSATAESVTLLTSTTNSVPGIQKSATAVINVKAGGTITFTGTSWATSTYTAKFRAEYLG